MPRSNESSKRHPSHVNTPPPAVGSQSIDAHIVKSAQSIGRYRVLEIGLPQRLVPPALFGKYVLVRCGSPSDTEEPVRGNWEIYLRRPLFMFGMGGAQPNTGASHVGNDPMGVLRFLLPAPVDPGYAWLADLPAEARLNLLGPFGRDTSVDEHARHLLLIAGVHDAPLLLPLADQMLDQSGRVSMIVRGPAADRSLLALLPIDVELHVADSAQRFEELLAESLPWSDALYANQSASTPQSLARAISRHRATFEPDYAHILVQADLVCGYGGCMACVVPRAGGSLTRACIHGPVFRLADLLR